MTCRCKAYAFPHRLGGGECPGTPWLCLFCEKRCHVAQEIPHVDYIPSLYGYTPTKEEWTERLSDCCGESVIFEPTAGQEPLRLRLWKGPG